MRRALELLFTLTWHASAYLTATVGFASFLPFYLFCCIKGWEIETLREFAKFWFELGFLEDDEERP